MAHAKWHFRLTLGLWLLLFASIFGSDEYLRYALDHLGPEGLPWTNVVMLGLLSVFITFILTVVQATFLVFAVTHLQRAAPHDR